MVLTKTSCLGPRVLARYGDVTIETNGGKMWAFFHIAVSCSLVAALISDVSDLSAERSEALHKMVLLKGRLDMDLMSSVDKNGDGVDKFEFVIGMLTKLEIITEEDVEPFAKLFDAMDKDGSGKLTADDLKFGDQGSTSKPNLSLEKVDETIAYSQKKKTATAAKESRGSCRSTAAPVASTDQV